MLQPLKILSSDDLKRVHEASLAILDSTGLIIAHEPTLGLLEDAGGRVSRAGQRAWLPPALVMEQLHQAGRRVVLGARTPDRDIVLDPRERKPPVCRPITGPDRWLDHHSGEARPATTRDLLDWARVVEQLPGLDFTGLILPCDMHLPSRDVAGTALMMQHTTKHIHTDPHSAEAARLMVELALAVAGSREELRRRPPLSWLQVCIPPLHLSRKTVELMLVNGEYGLPTFLNSSPIAGGTGPATLAGVVAQINAEILGMNCVLQLHHPGTPVVFQARPSLFEMQTMTAAWGCIEGALAAAAAVQLAGELHGLVTDAYGPTTESKLVDEQSAAERVWAALLPALAGARILPGAGNLDSQSCLSLLQLVLDHELLANIKRMVGGLEISDEHLALPVFQAVGPRGQFIAEEHTVRHCRSLYLPDSLCDRQSRPAWEASGKPTMRKAATERLEALLGAPPPPPLPEEVTRELHRIAEHARRALTHTES
jgi:trimethylamine--corrinoid protein Co-methyltransferase